MSDYRGTVYDPPKEGLPFLAVLLKPDGTVIAKPFDTSQAAAAHVEEVLLEFRQSRDH